MPKVIVVPAVTKASRLSHDDSVFSLVRADADIDILLIAEAVPDADRALINLIEGRAAYREICPKGMDYDQYLSIMDDYDREIEERRSTQHRWGVDVPDQRFEAVLVDPLEAELRWRLGDAGSRDLVKHCTVEMSMRGLTERFWDRRAEIEAWVEKHAKDDLLAQPTDSGWRFACPNYNDLEAFTRWLGEKKEHEITLPTRGPRYDEILAWCGENIESGTWFCESDRRKANRRVDSTFDNRFAREIILMIRHAKDAVHCKLRWSSLDDDEDEAA